MNDVTGYSRLCSPDWLRRLMRSLWCGSFDELPSKLMEYQADCGLEPTGFVDSPTRLLLIRQFPEKLAIHLTGPWLEECCLFEHALTETAIFDRCAEIMMARGAVVSELRDSAQILAIRGVEQRAGGYYRTGSARSFVEQEYGNRLHFSAAKEHYEDALFIVLWRDNGVKHARCFMGNVNPCAIWPAGTAHLNHGQYYYKIGRHRTREAAHIQAVECLSSSWPTDWVYDRTADSIQYIALEGTTPIEVIRSHGDSLDISAEDVERAEMAIAHREPTYVDELRIKINIHTCSMHRASSLGCQNIMPRDYAEFVNILLSCDARQKARYGFGLDISYTLIDASMIG